MTDRGWSEIISRDVNPESIFQLLEELGDGSYGSVYKAKHIQSGNLVAIKIIPIKKDLNNLRSEIKVLKESKSPFIITFHGAYIKNTELWLVLEYCPAGSIADIIEAQDKPLTEPQIAAILHGALKGLEYLHDTKTTHRDIKAGNILLDMSGNVKLADFGISSEAIGTEADFHSFIGSPFWMSPELVSRNKYSKKIDIWALGVAAIEMVEGVPPYSDLHPYRAIFAIRDKPPQGLSEPGKWSPEFNNFVEKCLTLDPEARPSAKELLEHPFVRNREGKTILRELVISSARRVEEYRANRVAYRRKENQQKKLIEGKQTINSEYVREGDERGSVVIHKSFGGSAHQGLKYYDTMIVKDCSEIGIGNNYQDISVSRSTLIADNQRDHMKNLNSNYDDIQEFSGRIDINNIGKQNIEEYITRLGSNPHTDQIYVEAIMKKVKQLERDMEVEIIAIKNRYNTLIHDLKEKIKAINNKQIPTIRTEFRLKNESQLYINNFDRTYTDFCQSSQLNSDISKELESLRKFKTNNQVSQSIDKARFEESIQRQKSKFYTNHHERAHEDVLKFTNAFDHQAIFGSEAPYHEVYENLDKSSKFAPRINENQPIPKRQSIKREVINEKESKVKNELQIDPYLDVSKVRTVKSPQYNFQARNTSSNLSFDVGLKSSNDSQTIHNIINTNLSHYNSCFKKEEKQNARTSITKCGFSDNSTLSENQFKQNPLNVPSSIMKNNGKTPPEM